MSLFKPYLTLCRVNISLFAAYSALMGYLLAPSHRTMDAMVPVAAVFILACGASALNQYQERAIDAKMERTRRRPLPSGAITPARALIFSLALISTGLALLEYSGGAPAFALGLLAILWYNGVYTPLKKATAFASLPGALVGMLPPAIGWAAAGGALMDLRIAGVCFIFFLWQVPHFWLLLLDYGEEYRKAALPSLVTIMSKQQIARISYAWIVAATTASLALPLYGSIGTPFIYTIIILIGFLLLWNARILIGARPSLSASPVVFRSINVYIFIIMSILSLQHIIVRP